MNKYIEALSRIYGSALESDVALRNDNGELQQLDKDFSLLVEYLKTK